MSKNIDLPRILLESDNSRIIGEVLDISQRHWLIPEINYNFNLIAEILKRLEIWDFESQWTFAIYKDASFYFDFVKSSIEDIKDGKRNSIEREYLIAKVISFITSTTIRELRDLSTIYLVEFGKQFPLRLLQLAEFFATVKDVYIYERIVASCYGVALNLQNDSEYISKYLPQIVKGLYDLQFGEKPVAPVYNYIVIDSIKHLVDLALSKQVFSLSSGEYKQLAAYQFNPLKKWTPPTDDQVETINRSNYMSYPDPIRMDFGIYTIPRLLIDDHPEDRDAIVNVYKRIFEIGYQLLETDFNDELFLNFFRGYRLRKVPGKLDRLGKKYCWKGFFDYAGFLLLNGKLNVIEENSEGNKYYQRLSDVDIDISLPKRDYKLKMKIYPYDMLAERNDNPEWYNKNIIDSVLPFTVHKMYDNEYVMLYAIIGQRLNEGYTVRSSLFVDTLFIEKGNNFEKIKNAIRGKTFDWQSEIYISYESLRNVYFGEIYWADNIPQTMGLIDKSIATGNTSIYKRKLTKQDILYSSEYDEKDLGREIDDFYEDRLNFQGLPTLLNYLWESESEVLNGFGEYFPSIKMGQTLKLTVDPNQTKILDANFKECFHCISYQDEKFFSNSINYMRSDLLKKFMADNNLALLYQIKQHSYDDDYKHYRKLKFFIYENNV